MCSNVHVIYQCFSRWNYIRVDLVLRIDRHITDMSLNRAHMYQYQHVNYFSAWIRKERRQKKTKQNVGTVLGHVSYLRFSLLISWLEKERKAKRKLEEHYNRQY